MLYSSRPNPFSFILLFLLPLDSRNQTLDSGDCKQSRLKEQCHLPVLVSLLKEQTLDSGDCKQSRLKEQCHLPVLVSLLKEHICIDGNVKMMVTFS